MIVEGEKKCLEEDFFIIKVLAKNFEHRFYYKYLEKVNNDYYHLMEAGITHIIYSEPNWLIIASIKKNYNPTFPFNRKNVFNKVDIICYTHNNISDVRASLEEKYYAGDLRKALIIEELEEFGVEELRDGPGGVPLSPLEEIALMPGFVRIELEGMILRIKDYADINKKLYKPH
nr:hypothetical protein [Nanoarchaeota archaeon]